MDERAARDVVLAHAIEATDHNHQLLRAEELRQASLSARNMGALKRPRDTGHSAADSFLGARAALLLDALEKRMPSVGAMRRPPRLMRLAGWIVPTVALLAGALTERIANPHRMDLLSLPLLGVIGWNVLMYILLFASALLPLRGLRRLPSAASRLSEIWMRRQRHPPAMATALVRFSADWRRLAAPLDLARIRRALHLSAALFGLGVASSLYVRGLIVEYRVGWESTFLDAGQVHAILRVLFAPAAWLLQLPGFSPDEIAALRFGTDGGTPAGARWVHLYAALLGVVVIIPRLLLAAAAHWRVRHLRRNFPLDLGLPYYRKLLGALSPTPLRLRVIPYSFAVDARRSDALQAVARSLLGETAQASIMPTREYGSDADDTTLPTSPGEAATLTAALVNLAATPEAENHGAFLDSLKQVVPGKVVLLVDQSAYAARLAAQPDAARRIQERKRLWQDFGDLHQVPVTFVDLLLSPTDA